ncbi:MAG: amidase [Acidobacteria bacterium]|nr:MAG: amidase [Acidobacteriota bacterium]
MRKNNQVDRRGFIGSVAAGGIGLQASARAGDRQISRSKPFRLEETTITDLQKKMQAGELSAESITKLYLDRIKDLDPHLQAIIELNPEALGIAKALDQERKAKGPRGPLHGIPVVLKDNIDTHDKMTTTAGSLALEGSVPARDAFVAGKLRNAGAVLLAKANLSEWANFRSDNSSSGWSGRGGQCRNPYALDRNPCGSSSGSAVAVSANLCAVAVGTETNGSIMCPSNANGIVGIKPTVGLVSRSGIIPIAHTQDTAGPMARTVADAAILLGAMAGVDTADKATAASQERGRSDYTPFLDPGGLKGARIGVAREFLGFHPEVDRLMNEAVALLKKEGAILVDPVEIPERRELGRHSFQVLLYEFKADLNAYLASLGPGARVRNLEELIRFNDEHRDREMPYFGQEIFIKAQEKGPLTTQEYLDSLEKCRVLSREKGIDRVMEEKKLDALVAPTGGPAWLIDLVNGDSSSGGSSSPAAVAGYPNITVPMGYFRGLPVGISFFGRAWSEPALIKIAYSFEQAGKVRKPPQLLTTVAL